MSSSEAPDRAAVVPPLLSRRRFLTRTLLVSAGLGLGGLTLHQASGYALPDGAPAELEALSAKEFVVLLAAARVVLEGLAPEVAPDAVAWADGYLARRDVFVRRDVSGLLLLLEHGAPLFSGRLARFTRLDPPAQAALLRGWARSERALLRQAFLGLKGLLLMGAYGQEPAWAAAGYPGPVPHVPRPR